jgi:N-acetylglucosaminyl-diphospho-decaprenol L-rhamnosyltransferase
VKVLGIIVNFRTPELTLRALCGLLREMETVPTARVVVIENDSGDGSFDRIAAAVQEMGASDRVSIVASGRNGGFAFGVNEGIRWGLASGDPPESVYLLNSDAIPDTGSLHALLAFQDAHPAAAIVGSYIHGPEGEPHGTAFRFPTWQGELLGNLRLGILGRLLGDYEIPLPIPTAPMRVDWLAGASMLIRRDVFDAIGLFDEDFFLYYEETDFCHRAAAAGLETWYVPGSSVAHVGSASTGFKDTSQRRASYWFESRRHYLQRHHGRGYLLVANLAWMLGFLIWRLRRRLLRMPDTDPPRLLRDFVRHTFVSRGAASPRPQRD